MHPRVSMIAALARENRGIGLHNKLLWHLPEDLAHFKNVTKGHPVIMGRKTFDSIVSYIGGPLPGRTNIVVSRQASFTYPGVIVAPTLEDAIENAKVLDTEEVFIGGGATIYHDALPLTDRLYLTLVDAAPEADTFFPPYEEAFPRIIESKKAVAKNGTALEWQTRERAS